MKTKKHKYLPGAGVYLRGMPACVCAAILIGSASCSSDHGAPDGPEARQATLTVRLSVSSSSRAIGDYIPELPGVNHENDIDNIFLWFYRDSPAGPNGEADVIYSTLVDSYQIISTSSGERQFTIELTGYKPAQGDRILAVANMGDMSRLTSLKAIREAVSPATWTGSGADAGGFAMASARFDDGIVTAPAGDNPEAPFTASVSIERLAARIDLRFTASNIEPGNGLCYTAIMPGAKKDLVHLTHVVPTNVMQPPTYVLKHVTADAADGCFDRTTVCGYELVNDISGVPVNYVVEPHTATKGDASNLTALYGSTRAGGIDATAFGSAYGLAALMEDDRLLLKDGNDRALILSYANENTHHTDMADSRFVTGLMLDIFCDTPGVNALCCTVLSFARKPIFHLYVSTDDDLAGRSPSARTMGAAAYMKFMLTMVLAYCAIESFQLFSPGLLVLRIAASTVYTFVMLYGLDILLMSRSDRH